MSVSLLCWASSRARISTRYISPDAQDDRLCGRERDMLTQSQLISEGSAKLASVPSGGAAAGGAAPAAAAGGAAEEAPKEAEKEEEKEESDEDMGFGLFD
jgi:large subunit ribosomal protein LP2